MSATVLAPTPLALLQRVPIDPGAFRPRRWWGDLESEREGGPPPLSISSFGQLQMPLVFELRWLSSFSGGLPCPTS
eukprot:13739015-Alexandrium_andersonii.AAC.1